MTSFFPRFESHWKLMRNNKNGTWKEWFREKNELIEVVRDVYNQISEDTIFNLIESCQRRILKYIENDEDRVP